MRVYPNPTTNYLTLKVEDNTNLSYELYDIKGKIIDSKTVTNNSTNISLEGQPSAVYFLSVVHNSQIVKTFKIIKN